MFLTKFKTHGRSKYINLSFIYYSVILLQWIGPLSSFLPRKVFLLHPFVAYSQKSFTQKWIFFDSWKFLTRKLFQNSPNAKVFVKNFAIFWARESFCPQKFLPLKYPTFVIPITDTRDLFGVGEVHILRSKSIRGLLSKSNFCKSTNIEAYVLKF